MTAAKDKPERYAWAPNTAGGATVVAVELGDCTTWSESGGLWSLSWPKDEGADHIVVSAVVVADVVDVDGLVYVDLDDAATTLKRVIGSTMEGGHLIIKLTAVVYRAPVNL